MRGRTWSPQNPIEGPRQRLYAGDSHSPPLPLPLHLPGYPAWSLLGLGQSPGLPPGEGWGRSAPGSAQGAGRGPSTHPHLERLRGGKAQPRTAFLSRSRATRLRSWSGCSRCRGCPLVGFTKGVEGQEVNAATARAAGRSRRPVLTSEGPARTPRSLIPRLLLSSEKRVLLAWPARFPVPNGRRACVRPADTSHLFTFSAWKPRERGRALRLAALVSRFPVVSLTCYCIVASSYRWGGCATQYSWAGTKMQATETFLELWGQGFSMVVGMASEAPLTGMQSCLHRVLWYAGKVTSPRYASVPSFVKYRKYHGSAHRR